MNIHECLALEHSGVISIVGAGGKTTLMYALARELAADGRKVLTTTTTRIFPPAETQSAAVLLSCNPAELVERAGRLLEKDSHLTAASEYLQAEGKLRGLESAAIDHIAEAGLFDFIVVEADGAARKSLKACGPDEPVVPGCSDRVVAVAGLDAVGKPLSEKVVFRSAVFSRISGLELSGEITEAAIAAAISHDMSSVSAAGKGILKIAFLNKADSSPALQAGRRLASLLEKREEAAFDRVIVGELKGEPVIHTCRTLPHRRGA